MRRSRYAQFALRNSQFVILLLLPLIFLWRPLFGGEALFWGTPMLQFVPWQRLAAGMWRSGHLPLWNPLLGCGAPLAANYQSGAFYPLYGLALLLPPEVALGWSVALHLVLTGLGMYGWARATGLDRFPALLSGLALQGCGFLVARAGLFPSIAVTFPWLALWLWRSERLVQTGRGQDALWLGGVLGLGLLAGHAQTAFYGLLLLALYVLFRCLQVCRPFTRLLRRLLPFTFALILGLGIAAIQLLPTAELFAFSQRAAGVNREIGLTYSFWPWRLLTLVAPDLFGNPARGGYWGYGNYWEDALYAGLLPLLLALEAVMGLQREHSRRGAVLFWASVAGGALFLSLGRNNPAFLWLFDHVPTFDWFQAPSRWLALFSVALAALAGIGAQNWRRGRADRRRGGLGVALGLAIVIGGLAAPLLLPAIRPSFGPATARLGLTLAAAGGLVLVRREASWWRVAVAGFLLLDLLLAGWGLAPSIDRRLYAGRTATSEALASDSAGERIFWPAGGRPEPGYDLKFERYFRFDTFGSRDLDDWWALRETLLPNLAMLDGVPSANNFEPLLVSWTAAMSRVADSAPSVLRVMGVTHLVTTTVNGRTAVTELSGALGRVWVVPTARVVPREGMLAELATPTFDPAAQVLLESPAPRNSPLTIRNSQFAPHNSLTLHDAPNRVTIHAVLDRPGYLVLADTWYPGWEAAVDGETVPLLRANYAFRAVYLEAGEHTVEMVYRPLSVRVGGWVSLVALTVLVGGWLVACRRERQT